MNTSAAPSPGVVGIGSLAVSGGKGGVGKSNLVLNLAVALGRWGRRILLVDGDLGLANLDVLLGLMPRHNVEHLVRGEIGFEEALLAGPPGVRILPAASGVPNLARLERGARERLLLLLEQGARNVDDVLVDTSGGLSETTLALQLASTRVLLVTTPEPTSLVDAYATLKVLWNADPDKRVDLVVNATRDDNEGRQIYEQVAKAAGHFLGRQPGFLGSVQRDPKVSAAVRRQRSILELFPDCPAARCYERIALQLVSQPGNESAAADYWQRLMQSASPEVAH